MSAAPASHLNVEPAVEQFLEAIEKKTDDPVHRRLLKAARAVDSSGALEAEFQKIIGEFIDDHQKAYGSRL